jgi:hypothetical protein
MNWRAQPFPFWILDFGLHPPSQTGESLADIDELKSEIESQKPKMTIAVGGRNSGDKPQRQGNAAGPARGLETSRDKRRDLERRGR